MHLIFFILQYAHCLTRKVLNTQTRPQKFNRPNRLKRYESLPIGKTETARGFSPLYLRILSCKFSGSQIMNITYSPLQL